MSSGFEKSSNRNGRRSRIGLLGWLALYATAVLLGCGRPPEDLPPEWIATDASTSQVTEAAGPGPSDGRIMFHDVAATPPVPDGGIPLLDAGPFYQAGASCSSRPSGCPFHGSVGCVERTTAWMARLAAECQPSSGCRASGWFAVVLDPDGCAVSVGMTDPTDAFLGCILDGLNLSSCFCAANSTQAFYLGPGPC
jgi:hypothetical protein